MAPSTRWLRDRARSWTPRRQLAAGLPALFVAVYAAAYFAPFPLRTWYNIPHTTIASITGYRPAAALGLALAGLLSVWLCWQMWRLALTLPRRTALLLILAGWLGASACAIFTFPGFSTDLGDYIFRAHMFVHLGHNPFTTAPSQIIAWKEFPYLSWYWEPDFYGPLWQWLSGAVHALAGEDLLANYLAYKLLAAGAIAISGALIYAILMRRAPRYAAAGLTVWLWNPVVINEGIIHGHNDLVMLPLVLSGIALLLHGAAETSPRLLHGVGADVAGVLCLIAAGLIKANIWILLPVAAAWLVHRRGLLGGAGRVALGALAGAGLIWLVYRPFGGWQYLLLLVQRRSWWPANSWTAALFFALRDGAKWPHAVTVRWIIGGASALFMAVAGMLLLRVRELRLMAWAVIVAYLLIGSHWFQPWYVTWAIALAAVHASRRVVHYTLLLSGFMLLHPIILSYFASRLKLPPGGFHALMAATGLLAPQLRAAFLAVQSARARPSHNPGPSRLMPPRWP